MKVDRLNFITSASGLSSDDALPDKRGEVPLYFPLLTLIQRNMRFPSFLRKISNIYPILQGLMISFWPHILHKPTDYEEYLINIFFFFTCTNNKPKILSFSIVVMLLALVSLIVVGVVLVFYRIYHTTSKPLLLTLALFNHVVNPIIIIPLGYQFGAIILLYKTEDSLAYLVLAIIEGFLLVGHSVFIFVTYNLDSISIYYSESLSYCFNGFVISLLIYAPALLCSLSFVAELFHEYMQYGVIVLHMILAGLVTYLTFDFPFAHPHVNYLIASFLMSLFLNDIMCLTPAHEKWIRYPAYLGNSFISTLVMYILLNYRKKYLLTVHENDTISRNILTLRVGMMFHHPIFMKGELMENISRNAVEPTDRLHLAALICYFPDFQPLFIAQIAMLRKAHNLSIKDKFLLYQMRRLEVGRQRIAKVDELTDICRESTSLRNTVQNIWYHFSMCAEYDFFKDVDSLARANYRCHHQWNELLALYPNNSVLADEYARFLIECESDFTNGAEWHYKAVQLQEGKSFNYDDSTISFLKCYPNYASKILPKTKLSNTDDVDATTKQNALATMVHNPAIKIEFQRVTADYRLFSLRVLFVVAALTFLVYILFWISFIAFMWGNFDDSLYDISLVHSFAKLTEQVSATFIPIIFDGCSMDWVSRMPSKEAIHDAIGVDRFVCPDPIINHDENYLYTASRKAELGMTMLNDVHDRILQQIIRKNYLQIVLDSFFNNTLPQTYYLTVSISRTGVSNLQSAFISFLSKFRSIAMEVTDEWINKTGVYDAAAAGTLILKQMEFVNNAFLLNDNSMYETKRRSMLIFISIMFSLFFAVSVTFPWISFVFIRKYFRKMEKNIRKLPPDVIREASMPLVITTSHEETDNNKMKGRGTTMIELVISSLISIVLSFFIVNNFFLFQEAQKSITHDSYAVLITSSRVSVSLEVLYYVMSANFFYFLVPPLKAKYDALLKEAIDRFKLLQRLSCEVNYDERSIGKEINKLRTITKCEGDDWLINATVHEGYSCLSMDQGITYYIEMAEKIQKIVHDVDLFKTEKFINFMHYELYHLYHDLNRVPDLVMEAADFTAGEYYQNIVICGVVSIVLCILLFCINIDISRKLNKSHHLLVSLISRVHPKDIINNSELLDVLLNVKQKKQSDLSPYARVVEESSLPVIFVNRDFIIEAVNTSFSVIFGYDTNFITCQPITSVINNDCVTHHLETLRFTCTQGTTMNEIECFKENQSSTLVNITFVPIPNGSGGNMVHTALILSDSATSQLFMKRYSHMKHSNDLLTANNMLPSIIKMSENGNFTKCAICLIKIQNNHNDTPTRLILQRQNCYETFNQALKIYSLLTLLSIRNGIYSVVASGSQDPTDLAIECLNFAFTIAENFANTATWGSFSAVVDVGSNLSLFMTDDFVSSDVKNGVINPKMVCFSDMINNGEMILAMNQYGKVCITEETYKYVAQHDLTFIKKEYLQKMFYIADYNHEVVEQQQPDNNEMPFTTELPTNIKKPKKNSGILPMVSALMKFHVQRPQSPEQVKITLSEKILDNQTDP